MASMGLSSRSIIGNFYQMLEAGLGSAWFNGAVWEGTSDQQYEEYRFLDQVPAMRRRGGADKPETLQSKRIVIANDEYESSLIIPTSDLRRDKTGQIMARVGQLADRAISFFDSRLMSLVLSGTATTTYGACYDGQAFFSTTHSEGDSGTLKNIVTSTEVPALNVADAAAPTELEMSQAILNTAMYFFTYKDDKGEPMNGEAREFTVVCNPSIAGASLGGIYNATVAGASGNTTANALYGLTQRGWKFNLVPSPRVTTAADFYTFRTDGRTKPLIRQQEVGVTMKALGLGSEYETKNDASFYGVRWVGGFGYGQWQHAIKATLS